MRKSPYFAMSLLLAALSAQAADVTGTTPSPTGASGDTSTSTNTRLPNAGVNTQTGVNASTTNRDAPLETTLPGASPLQSATPTESPSSNAAGDNSGTPSGSATPRMRGTAGTSSTTSTPSGTAPDNTRINQRDRNNQTLTPGDQANTSADISTTASIRQALMKSDLSTIARNIKIITDNGRVTLRGPVKTAAEKARIESLARTAAGAAAVDNQLDVKATTY